MTPRTLIIAEAGVNHNGDLGLAKQLIDVAVETLMTKSLTDGLHVRGAWCVSGVGAAKELYE